MTVHVCLLSSSPETIYIILQHQQPDASLSLFVSALDAQLQKSNTYSSCLALAALLLSFTALLKAILSTCYGLPSLCLFPERCLFEKGLLRQFMSSLVFSGSEIS